jgi:hypothetical protein
MNIIIKNVTETPANDGLICELAKAGFPSGSVIYDVEYRAANRSCSWSRGGYDCIAYLGETCGEIPEEPVWQEPVKPVSDTVRHIVVNGSLYEVPEPVFEELNRILMSSWKCKPDEIATSNRKVLEKLEEIMDSCPIKIVPDAIYDTCDYL